MVEIFSLNDWVNVMLVTNVSIEEASGGENMILSLAFI